MNGIRSLADELRQNIKKEGDGAAASKEGPKPRQKKAGSAEKSVEGLLVAIQDFELVGKEKLLVRLDERTVFLMKQLKVAKGIDMNRLIAFCLDDYFHQHPELIQYIKDNIKNISL